MNRAERHHLAELVNPWFMVDSMDMVVVSVSSDIREATTRNVEGLNIVLKVASVVWHTMLR